MRKRFRGNRPIALSTELEADASGEGYQLYGGAPAYSSTEVKPKQVQEKEAESVRDG